MALPLWGNLQKAQDDAEKIEEAIVRLIQAHNEDSEAHLSAGESLGAHKNEPVLEHPAGSVLADKWTMTEHDFTTLFETIDPFVTLGNVFVSFPGARILSSASGEGGRSRLKMPFESRNMTFFPQKSFLWQFVFNVETWNNGQAWFNFGFAGSDFGKSGVGLKVINNGATFYTSDRDGDNGDELAWPGFTDSSDTFLVRIQYIAGDDFVSFFANGVFVGTLAWPIGAGSPDVLGGYFATQKDGAVNTEINILSFYFSLGL